MPDRRLYVLIRGIDMEYDAMELLKLFYDRDKITAVNSDALPWPDPGSMLIIADRMKDHGGCSVTARFYDAISWQDDILAAMNGERKPVYSSCLSFTDDELHGPGGRLLRSSKILYGTALYHVLKRVFLKELPYGSLTGVRPVKLAAMCLEEGLDEARTLALLQKVTGMTRQKAQLLFEVASQERIYMDGDGDEVNLYIGIPFCASRCLYCSFTSYPIDGLNHLVITYLDALERELEFGCEWIKSNQLRINALYIGGGTPTALPEDHFKRLLSMVGRYFDQAREFTVEAGRPDTMNEEKLGLIRSSGATRISINPQTMNAETLKRIGRNHTPEDIIEKFNLARQLGFDNINMDMIAGLPGENIEMFNQTLSRIEALGPENLTVHTMAIKRASKLHETLDEYESTQDSAVEQMILAARQSAGRMGMKPYYLYRQKNILANLENTGYAVPGKACRYNIETMAERQSIIAFGAGAISKIVIPAANRIKRTDNVKDVNHYINRIDEMIERKKRLFDETIG